MQTPRASGWQPGQPRRRRIFSTTVESLIVLGALVLMIAGAGALIGYVVVNHEPRGRAAAAPATTAPATTEVTPTTQAASTQAATTAAATTAAATTQPQGGGAADLAAGKKVFTTAGCTACHTLKDAGATGTVGPNLDQAKPPKSRVVDRVTNGKRAMPSFKGQLSPQQIDAVATYVSSVAGKG